jgi:integrase
MSATLRLAGWIELHYSEPRGEWSARLRYRLPGEAKKLNEGEAIWFEATDAEDAAARAEALVMDARIELTRRLARTEAPREARAALTTLEDFREEVWMVRRYPNLPANSKANHEQQWARWINPSLGGLTLAELGARGPEIGHLWIEQMQADGAGVPTITQVVALASGYLSTAHKWGYLKAAENPFANLELPEPAFREPDEFALEIEHVELLAWLTPGPLRNTLWTELVGCEALRQQDLGALTWADLFLEDWTPRAHMLVSKAISGRGIKREIKTLKRRSEGLRTPPFWEPVAATAAAVREQEGAERIDQRVFYTDAPDHLPDADNWGDRVWEPALERSGIEQDGRYGHLTPHRLRSAAGSALGYALRPRHEVIAFLGHSQESTSLTWYLRSYQSPLPELRGMSVVEQIRRARRLVLPQARAHVAKLGAAVTEQEAALERAKAGHHGKEARRHGAALTARRREFADASYKLNVLEAFVDANA